MLSICAVTFGHDPLHIMLPAMLSKFRNRQTFGMAMFLPHDCLGRNPCICRMGPVFTKDYLICPRWIITYKQDPGTHVGVTITRSPRPTSLFRQVGHNTFLILSQGEPFNVFCTRSPSKTGYLSYGLYVVHVRAGCRVAGRVWTLHGMRQHSIHGDITTHVIPIAPLNWSALVSHQLIKSKLQSPSWKFLPEIKYDEIITRFCGIA